MAEKKKILTFPCLFADFRGTNVAIAVFYSGTIMQRQADIMVLFFRGASVGAGGNLTGLLLGLLLASPPGARGRVVQP